MNNTITSGSDFSGVGAFDYAMDRVCKAKKLKHKRIYACDMDKYARITYSHNHGEPDYYPENVYDRDIPEDPLDVYMTSPPCQAFSMAGQRKGKDDERGILFFNSHEFIKKNKPRYAIFENVRGLISHDNGRTFQEWINYLGGKSVNGVPVLFPHEESVPYHIYWKVLNAKHHGVPQNRERVFIVCIRDDQDNNFRWPKEEPLQKALRDVLEDEVDEKYFLSEKMLKGFVKHAERQEENGTGFQFSPSDIDREARSITVKAGQRNTDNFIKCGHINQDTQASAVYDENGVGPTLTAGTHGYASGYVLRAGTWRTHKDGQGFREIKDGMCPTIPARAREDGSVQPVVQLQEDIRRLTPRECFRLMDFPEEFDFSVVSDTQAYKQAGNSIVVRVLEKILTNLI